MKAILKAIYSSLVDIGPLILFFYFLIVSNNPSTKELMIQNFVLFLYLNQKISMLSK